MIILRVGVVLDSVVWPRVVAPLGLPCRCCSHDCIHRSALCRLTLLLVSPVALLPPFAPQSASQSAISLPGTRHVRAHTGEPGNEAADALAKAAVKDAMMCGASQDVLTLARRAHEQAASAGWVGRDQHGQPAGRLVGDR